MGPPAGGLARRVALKLRDRKWGPPDSDSGLTQATTTYTDSWQARSSQGRPRFEPGDRDSAFNARNVKGFMTVFNSSKAPSFLHENLASCQCKQTDRCVFSSFVIILRPSPGLITPALLHLRLYLFSVLSEQMPVHLLAPCLPAPQIPFVWFLLTELTTCPSPFPAPSLDHSFTAHLLQETCSWPLSVLFIHSFIHSVPQVSTKAQAGTC